MTKPSVDLLRELELVRKDTNILELGYQQMHGDYPERARSWYTAAGAHITSVDLYEKGEGVLALDLMEEVPDSLKNKFDMVTNYGTIEHVGQSYIGGTGPQCPHGGPRVDDWSGIRSAFQFAHDACKEGGAVVHEMPEKDSWPGHGLARFTPEFFRNLCELCGYELLHCDRFAACGNTTDGWCVQVVYIKRGAKEVPVLDEFVKGMVE